MIEAAYPFFDENAWLGSVCLDDFTISGANVEISIVVPSEKNK